MKRREFLKTSALVVAGTAVAASGLINVAGASEWTGHLTTLQPHDASTLLAMAKRIFPHRGIDDACYLKVVEVLDANSKSDPAVAKMLSEGVAALDGSSGAKFAVSSTTSLPSYCRMTRFFAFALPSSTA